MSNFSDVVSASGSAFAACAAGAAWMTVIRGQRETRQRRRPVLQVSAVGIFGAKPSERQILLTVMNEGEGVARSVAFAVANSDTKEFSTNALAGFLRFRDEAHVRTPIQPGENLRALAMCRSQDKETYVWSPDGDFKVYDGVQFDPARDLKAFWSDFYDQDLDGWQRVGGTIAVGS